jgi:hypothetical protein
VVASKCERRHDKSSSFLKIATDAAGAGRGSAYNTG